MLHWELLECDEDLADMLADAAGRKAVAVDTEFMRRNTFFPQPALLQLCFEETAWLIDPLGIEDLDPLIRLMEDPGIVKILHSASEDLEVFQQWLGVLPQPLFDTQRAAAMVGRGFGLGYRALVADIEDVDLPKGETRSDWLQRPLTDSQCDYAALDVTHLLNAWQVLDAECETQGKRDWVLADGSDAAASLASNASGYYKRIKSAWKLNPRALGVLSAVGDWRERTARLKNKPCGWIIDDQACLQLAHHKPGNLSELQRSIDLPPPAIRQYGEDLLELLAEQRELPDEDMPRPLGKPLDAQQRDQVKRLKSAVKHIASEQTVTPEIILSGKDYEMLVREAHGEFIQPPLAWSGWRNDLVIAPLRELLAEEGGVKLICQLFKSPRKPEMYLYVEKSIGLQEVPESLLAQFGEPEALMVMVITPEKQLARANATEVMDEIRDNGFYLQMPPASAQLLQRDGNGS